MRLISQDGRVDLPYEMVCVSLDILNGLNIKVCTLAEVDSWTFAHYSTKERASMARKLMVYAYTRKKNYGRDYFRFPSDDDIEEQYNMIFKKGREV